MTHTDTSDMDACGRRHVETLVSHQNPSRRGKWAALLKNALHFVIKLKLVWLLMSECGWCIVTIMGGGVGVGLLGIRSRFRPAAGVFLEKRGVSSSWGRRRDAELSSQLRSATHRMYFNFL